MDGQTNGWMVISNIICSMVYKLITGNSDSSSSGLSSGALAGIGFSVCLCCCCCSALVSVFVGKRRSS